MPQIADNIKKVAITRDGFQAQFVELDQSKPLVEIIKEICDGWNLPNSEEFALQFSEANKQSFITEQIRLEINNGNVLKLSYSASKTAQGILNRLQDSSTETQIEALRSLSEFSSDVTVAQDFIDKDGLQIIIKMVEDDTHSGDGLGYLLKSFVELMDHGIVTWDVLETNFVKTVCTCTCLKPGTAGQIALQSALEILENIVLSGAKNFEVVFEDVTPVSLIPHLQSNHQEVQKNAIALINALFMKSDLEKRKQNAEQLQAKSIRNVILQYVIRGKSMKTEMAHQLYVLQSLMLGLLNEFRRTAVQQHDQGAEKELDILRKTAFEADPTASMNRRKSHVAEFKKLGFENINDPLEDFRVVPPGVLGLTTLGYFARNHAEDYSRVVLENSCRADDHDLPFAKACIRLTDMLCNILHIGETPSEDGHLYQPMFFTSEKPFEELFCACTLLLNKTWREMRASSADLPKVFSVVKEQIVRALETQPGTVEQFKIKLNALPYIEILKIWQMEKKQQEEWESQVKPILELREQIKPEIMDLIKQQRMNCLVEGACFKHAQTAGRRRDKYWFCRLSPNHKVLHYGDCEENDTPSTDQLASKLNVADVTQLLAGKECPLYNQKGRQKLGTFLFSLVLDTTEMNEPLHFVALNESDYDMWTDGLSAMLNKPMESKQAKTDLDTLLGMELKLRLLDTEGISIPENPPPIPEDPPNYDFSYSV